MLANSPSYAVVAQKSRNSIPQHIQLAQPQAVSICRECWTEISAGKLPRNAVNNNLHIEAQPSQLTGLNFIERILIQRVRPLQAIVLLQPMGWESPNPLRASKGGILYMPVPINSTLN